MGRNPFEELGAYLGVKTLSDIDDDQIDALFAGTTEEPADLVRFIRQTRAAFVDALDAPVERRHIAALTALTGQVRDDESIPARSSERRSDVGSPRLHGLGYRLGLRLAAVVVVGVVLTGGLAATGNLPGPMQKAAAQIAERFGIQLETPEQTSSPSTNEGAQEPDGGKEDAEEGPETKEERAQPGNRAGSEQNGGTTGKKGPREPEDDAAKPHGSGEAKDKAGPSSEADVPDGEQSGRGQTDGPGNGKNEEKDSGAAQKQGGGKAEAPPAKPDDSGKPAEPGNPGNGGKPEAPPGKPNDSGKPAEPGNSGNGGGTPQTPPGKADESGGGKPESPPGKPDDEGGIESDSPPEKP